MQRHLGLLLLLPALIARNNVLTTSATSCKLLLKTGPHPETKNITIEAWKEQIGFEVFARREPQAKEDYDYEQLSIGV